MQGRRVHSRRRKSAFPGALGRSKGRSSIGRFPRFSCGALKRRSFGGPRKRVPSPAPGILRRQSRLVRRLRRRTNRRVTSSTRQGHRKQKLSRHKPRPLCRESTDTPEGVPSVELRRKRLARTAGLSLPPGKVVNTKKISTLLHIPLRQEYFGRRRGIAF